MPLQSPRLRLVFYSQVHFRSQWYERLHDSSLTTDTIAKIAQFCIHNICKHSEYRERLRIEAVECKDASFGSLNQEMPYLDSFVKETARLSPGPIRKPAALRRDRRGKLCCRVLTQQSQRSSQSHGPVYLPRWLSHSNW